MLSHPPFFTSSSPSLRALDCGHSLNLQVLLPLAHLSPPIRLFTLTSTFTKWILIALRVLSFLPSSAIVSFVSQLFSRLTTEFYFPDDGTCRCSLQECSIYF